MSYASHRLQPREDAYSTIEREALALKWAVQKFHIYFVGHKFILNSDHKPLVYIKSAKHINSRVLRWSLILKEDFSVEYIKGSENVARIQRECRLYEPVAKHMNSVSAETCFKSVQFKLV